MSSAFMVKLLIFVLSLKHVPRSLNSLRLLVLNHILFKISIHFQFYLRPQIDSTASLKVNLLELLKFCRPGTARQNVTKSTRDLQLDLSSSVLFQIDNYLPCAAIDMKFDAHLLKLHPRLSS